MDVADAESERDPDICVDSEPGSEETEPSLPQTAQSSEKINISRRLKTFLDWAGSVLPLQLSIAGFIYKGPGDETKCESCGISVSNWKRDDKPLDVHRRRSPHCSFLERWFPLKHKNVIILDNLFDSTNARYQQFVSYANRLASFDVWPVKGELQSPSNMAEAGFLYIGSADRARCFNCGLTLRDWDTGDDPFDAHLTWSPNCQYIKMFHEERKKKTGIPLSSNNQNQTTGTASTSFNTFMSINSSSNSSSTFSSTPSSTSPSTSSSTFSSASSSNFPGNSSSVRWKHSVQVETVLAMGFSEELIHEAIERRRQTKEGDFPDATSLFCAVEALA